MYNWHNRNIWFGCNCGCIFVKLYATTWLNNRFREKAFYGKKFNASILENSATCAMPITNHTVLAIECVMQNNCILYGKPIVLETTLWLNKDSLRAMRKLCVVRVPWTAWITAPIHMNGLGLFWQFFLYCWIKEDL